MADQTMFAQTDPDTKGKTYGEFVLTPYKDAKDGKGKPVACPEEEVVLFRLWANQSDMGFNISGLWKRLRDGMEKDIEYVVDVDQTKELGYEVKVPIPIHQREDFTDVAKTKRGKALIQTDESKLKTRETAEKGMFCLDDNGAAHPVTKANIELIQYACNMSSGDPNVTRNGRPKGAGWILWEPWTRGGAMSKIEKFVGRLVKWEFRRAEKDKVV